MAHDFLQKFVYTKISLLNIRHGTKWQLLTFCIQLISRNIWEAEALRELTAAVFECQESRRFDEKNCIASKRWKTISWRKSVTTIWKTALRVKDGLEDNYLTKKVWVRFDEKTAMRVKDGLEDNHLTKKLWEQFDEKTALRVKEGLEENNLTKKTALCVKDGRQ